MYSLHNTSDVIFYTFPVIRGIQAGKEYYITMIPLNLIPKIFLFNEADVSPELRSQRKLNKGRIPAIAKYMIDNLHNYTFSSLTASIDRPLNFQPLPEDNPSSKIGSLIVPADAKFIINDGQHRKAAIEIALKQRPELGRETISVVLYIDAGLKRSQQMFADLNKYAVKPSASLSVLYDYIDPGSTLVKEIITDIPIFNNNLEFEKNTITSRSNKLFTLSAVSRATKTLVGNINIDYFDKKDLATQFWTHVSDNMVDWNRYLKKEVQAYELRRDSVAAHGLTLQSIATAGHACINTHPKNWEKPLRKLSELDWSRSNSDWEGRALLGGRLSISGSNIILTANYLKRKMGIPLTSIEESYEEEFRRKSNVL